MYAWHSYLHVTPAGLIMNDLCLGASFFSSNVMSAFDPVFVSVEFPSFECSNPQTPH
jgi:hypothetical protein